MDPTLIAIDAKDRHADRGFHSNEFWRLMTLVWPYRSQLIAGLAATVVFALLHTFSLAGAFPVFKTLLEEEGLRGWCDRTVASARVGLDWAQPRDNAAPVLRVRSVADVAAAGVQPGDLIVDVAGRPIPLLFHDIAHARSGDVIEVGLARRKGGETVSLRPVEAPWRIRLLRGVSTWIPADANQGDGKLRLLAIMLGAVVATVLLANVFRYIGEVLIATSVLRGLMHLRSRLYERTLRLPMSFFASRPTADVVTHFVQDIQEIQRGLLTLFGKCIREPLRAVLILSLALALDWRLTMTMVVVAPVTVLIFWRIGKSVKKANKKLLQGYSRMIDALTASLQNLRVVKAYTAEEHEHARLVSVDLAMFRQQLKLTKLQAGVTPGIESLAVIAGSVATLWLAGRVVGSDLEIAEFLSLGIVLGMLFDPLRKLTDVYVRVQRSTAGAERIFRILDEPVEQEFVDAEVALGPLEERIEFCDVSFAYPGAPGPAVDCVSFTIRRGETLAIVGPNGCGKTTLVSLLPRFFDPHSGTIRYDGIDLRRATLESLRSQISMVSQDAIIFAGSPIENIAYGVREPVAADVEQAARHAFAEEFIREIPGGFNATLGERGSTLSGGQRQRIAIARAIYRDAPILIFDEATSQIDSESELKIQQALRSFARNRTTLIIAHRLSTIQFADRILVMDAGRVLDSGSHRQLFDRCAFYRNLCETQFVTESVAQTPRAVPG